MRSLQNHLHFFLRIGCVAISLIGISLAGHDAQGQTPTAKEMVQKYIDAPANPTWKLEFADAFGGVIYRFFDKESGLLVKEVNSFVTTYFSNYRDVDGVKIAHMESIDLGGGIKSVLTKPHCVCER